MLFLEFDHLERNDIAADILKQCKVVQAFATLTSESHAILEAHVDRCPTPSCTEMFYDFEDFSLMKHNYWLKQVVPESGKNSWSLKQPFVVNVPMFGPAFFRVQRTVFVPESPEFKGELHCCRPS